MITPRPWNCAKNIAIGWFSSLSSLVYSVLQTPTEKRTKHGTEVIDGFENKSADASLRRHVVSLKLRGRKETYGAPSVDTKLLLALELKFE